jgi:ABC-2 type transport system ATP-binding protein
MREYAKAEDKTVFLTSHIIQDMERLVDDCIVMDYGKILVQMPVEELLGKFRRYTAQVSEGFRMQDTDGIYNPSVIRQTLELFSMLPETEVRARLSLQGVADVQVEKVGLEDAFIGLTGKY